jgi:ketosteroid isomerase-like protein
MFYRIVEQTVRSGFTSFSEGNYKPIVEKFASNASFRFIGDHAMGADLHDISAIREWFERVLRLFPGIQFDVQDVKVSGTPWNTTVITQLRIRATLRDGRPYQNTALQLLRLRWGRIIEDTVYEDTHVLVQALSEMAQQGIQEAEARPIIDTAA